jgi:hypothetical protein
VSYVLLFIYLRSVPNSRSSEFEVRPTNIKNLDFLKKTKVLKLRKSCFMLLLVIWEPKTISIESGMHVNILSGSREENDLIHFRKQIYSFYLFGQFENVQKQTNSRTSNSGGPRIRFAKTGSWRTLNRKSFLVHDCCLAFVNVFQHARTVVGAYWKPHRQHPPCGG